MDKRYCPYCMAYVGEDEVCPACGRRPSEYEAAPFHLPAGTLLRDKYLVGGVLGEGGFGITYVGRDLTLDMKVAIKEFYPREMASRSSASSVQVYVLKGGAGAGYQKGKARFLHEAQLLARLEKQPAIVRVRDFFEDNNTAYIVMEFVEGITLKDLVAQRGGKIPPEELFPLVEPLFKALSVVHAAGLIHRDISPDNIMLEGSQVRLLDFGCARDTMGEGTQSIYKKEGYTPPEQYQSKGQGPWTDVYAFCATIYYCLTGQTPPPSFERMGKDKLRPPTKLGVHLSERQEQALLKGLSCSVGERYSGMEELYKDLYAFAPPPAPKKRWLLPAAAALGAAAVIGALFATGVLPPEPKVTATPEPTVTAEPTATPEPTPTPTPAPGSGEALDTAIFSEGRSLSGGTYGREDLDAMASDPYVTAVVLEQGAVLDLNDPAAGEYVLKKPLWVKKGAVLRANWLTIPGGVSVEMDGTLDCRGILTLEGSATRLYMTGDVTGDTLDYAAVVMDSGANIGFQSEDLAGSMRDMLLPVPRKTEDMVSVTQADELLEAMDNGQSVTIDADMTIPQVFVPTGATVWISEGVTVDADGHTGFYLYGKEGPVTLVNQGTYLGELNTTEGPEGTRVFNYGTMETGSRDAAVDHALYFESGVLINYGEYATGGIISRIWENGRMINLGSADLYNFTLLGRMSNMGAVSGSGSAEQNNLEITGTGVLYNAGTLTGGFRGSGLICNDGIFEDKNEMPADVDIYNRGTVRLSGSSGCHVAGPGGVQIREEGPRSAWTYQTASPRTVPEGAVSVRDENTLRQAVSQGQTVILEGSVTLREPMEIRSPLYVAGSLRGTRLTAYSAPVVILSGGSVTAEELFLEPAEGQDDWTQLSMTEGSALAVTGTMELRRTVFCAEGGSLDLTGAAVNVTDASRVIPARLDAFRLDNAALTLSAGGSFRTPSLGAGFAAEGLRLQVQGGVMRIGSGGDLTGADITVAEAPEQSESVLEVQGEMDLRSSTVNVEAFRGGFLANFCYLHLYDTKLTNRGGIRFGGWDEHYVRTDRASRITNYGDIAVDLNNVTLQQPIDNQGELRLHIDRKQAEKFDMYMGNPPIIEG